MAAPPAAREGLWALIIGPSIWAIYFVLAYATAAIWCARFAPDDGTLGGARILIAGYALVALLLIALSAHRGFRRHSYGESAGPPHDKDTDESRHRFLGLASLLLSGLAAVATLFVALPLLLTPSCQ